jgi:hypothetical protein
MSENDPRSCPYSNYPDTSFWSKSVAQADVASFDPVVGTKFRIASTDKIATAGSCFAQHIARHLKRSGYQYFVTEKCPDLFPDDVKQKFNFEVFSARYGNIYTARQLLQLFDRVYAAFVPVEDVWRQGDRLFDPFRPHIQPGGFGSLNEYRIDREQHFRAVRSLFENCDVFIFTLGLTEAWESCIDQSVFPVCPGCGVGSFDASKYRFVNFDYDDTLADMTAFCERLRAVNPAVRVLLTISPVPLIATAEPRHVLVSTVYSKSVLRAVAGKLEALLPFAGYFPSYEIITGQQAGNEFFAQNRRSVTELGVEAVMRVFMRHYCSTPTSLPPYDGSLNALPDATANVPANSATRSPLELVCDEEQVEAFMRGYF